MRTETHRLILPTLPKKAVGYVTSATLHVVWKSLIDENVLLSL